MTDFANLGLRFVPVDDAAANKALTDVAANSTKAESATKKLTATQAAAANAQKAVAQAAQAQAAAVGQMGEAMQVAAAQQAASIKAMESAAALHGKVAGATKITAAETLNLSRQFADVAVTGAMGMSPLMILIQQGPQIGETIGAISTRAGGMSAALKLVAISAWEAVAPFAPFIAAAGLLAAAIGGPLLMATHELNKGNDDLQKRLGLTDEQMKKAGNTAVTVSDVIQGTFKYAAKAIGEQFAPQITWLQKAFSAAYEFIKNATVSAVKVFAGLWGAQIAVIQALWHNVKAFMKGEPLIDVNDAALKGFAEGVSRVERGMSGLAVTIREVRDARVLEAAGTAKATKELKDHNAALKEHEEALDRTQPITADMSKAVDLNEVKAVKMTAAIRELNGELKQMPVYIDPAVTAMEEFYQAANQAGSGVDQMFNGLKNRDWMSAVSGLLRAAKAVQDAFAKGGTTAGKIGAVAGIADAAGQAIGGTAGGALSGAAGGAMAGFTLGGPVGAAIGSVVGGIVGIFSASSQKKAQKEAAAQAAREAEAQRQAQILQQRRQIEVAYVEATGTALEILEAQRKAELEGIDESNKAMALALYAAQDQKRRDEEGISLMRQLQAMDDAVAGTTVALTAAREDEVKALDPANRYLAELIYKRQDEADLIAKTAAAAAEAEAAKAAAAEKAAATQATQIGLMRQLQAMDDAVLGTNVVLLATRADELAKLDDVSQGLQKIIWAREDEAKVIAANSAALEAANAKAAEMLAKRTDLEDQLLTAMGRTSEVMARQRGATMTGLDPSLRGLQSALDAVTDANARVAAAETGVASARSALTDAYERESSALKTTIDRFKGFTDSLRAFRSQLMTGDLAANGPSTQYSRTKADFERVAGLAAQGNEKALGDLQGVSEAYLKASGDYQRTNIGYFRDLSAVKNATKAAEGYASQQVDTATAQLAALDASVSGLMTVNASVLSVRDAIAGMSAALSELAAANSGKSQADAAAQAALQASKVAGVTIGANDNADVAAAKALYLSSNGGIDSTTFDRYVGANPFATMKRLGYDGDPEALRAKYKFATGGAFSNGIVTRPTDFEIGQIGEAGPEGVLPLTNVGGRLGVHSTGGDNSELVAEIRALRAEVASLRSDGAKTANASEKTAKILTSVTRDGEKLLTEAA